MINIFAYQFIVDSALRGSSPPKDINKILNNSQYFHEYLYMELNASIQNPDTGGAFLFLSKYTLLNQMIRRNSDEFKTSLILIKHRISALRNIASYSVSFSEWIEYFSILEKAFNRLSRLEPLESFEIEMNHLNWSTYGKDLIIDFCTIIGFVYFEEEDPDQNSKARLWLSKVMTESDGKSNLAIRILIALRELQRNEGEISDGVSKIIEEIGYLIEQVDYPDLRNALGTVIPNFNIYIHKYAYSKLSLQERLDYFLSNNLDHIDLSKLSLKEFPNQLLSFTEIISIDLSGNQLTELPIDIDKLSCLKRLNLSKNRLNSLPNTIRNISRNIDELNIKDNAFNIPLEILSQTPSNIIDFALRLQREKGTPLREAKLIFIGNGGAGKTSLINRLIYDKFNPNENKTDGIQITPWRLKNKDEKIKVNIWDFGGQEIMHATHKFFMTSRSVYVLVINPRIDDRYGDTEIEYWLKLIKSFAGINVPIIIAINKSDLHEIDIGEGTIKDNFPNVIGIVKTSCVRDINIQRLQRLIRKGVKSLSFLGDMIPSSFHEVKSFLERKNVDYISYFEYEKICNRVDPTLSSDEKASLVKLLHDLGIMLNFSEERRLKDTQVLNPEWVTKGVYQIITSPKTASKRGILYYKTILRILDKNLYPTDKEKYYIVDMMEHFELSYANKLTTQYFIPGAFPKDKPPINIFDQKKSEHMIQFFYVYDILPASVISRMITKVHHLIYSNKIWRNGVSIIWEKCNALIEANPIERQIKISIIGNGNRRALLSIIREKFMMIHKSLSGINVKQMIPIAENILVNYEDLLVYEEEGEAYYFEPKLRERISIKKLLDGVNMTRKDTSYLKELVGRNKLSEVLSILKDLYDDRNEVVLQIARLTRLEKEIRQGISNNSEITANQLVNSILELIDNI